MRFQISSYKRYKRYKIVPVSRKAHEDQDTNESYEAKGTLKSKRTRPRETKHRVARRRVEAPQANVSVRKRQKHMRFSLEQNYCSIDCEILQDNWVSLPPARITDEPVKQPSRSYISVTFHLAMKTNSIVDNLEGVGARSRARNATSQQSFE